MKDKVVGVGMIKTGITSLGGALEILNYKSKPYRLTDFMIYFLSKKYSIIKRYIDDKNNQYFKDLPFLLMYKKIYKRNPNTKFILTLRNEDEWYNSLCFHSQTNMIKPFYKRLFGVNKPCTSKKKCIDSYRKHNEEVIEFFKDKPGKLLIVSWEKGDGWKEICNFLEKDEPNVPFPHLNKRSLS